MKATKNSDQRRLRKDPSTKAASPVKTTTFLTDPVKHLRSKVFMGLGHKNGATKCITVWA